jgi:hypothetical protein
MKLTRIRKILLILAIAAFIPILAALCSGWGLLPPIRKSITVHFRVMDDASRPVSGAKIQTYERQWHMLLPIPFFSPTWTTQTRPKTCVTDADGKASVSYRRDFLELDQIIVVDNPVLDYTAEAVFNGHPSHFSRNGISERYFAQSNPDLPFEPTYVLHISRKVEQAGTGQPATRPELKSEGSNKPQLESEGHSW